MRKSLFFVVALLVATILACGFSASTANVSDAKMVVDSEGDQSTTVYAQDDTFYAVVQVDNAPDDTAVKAVWIAVDVDDVDPNLVIGDKELVGGGTLTFSLSNTGGKFWPVGDYKADIYLNDELDRSLQFKVEGETVAEEPTPKPEPSDTPEPEPTDTPVSEAAPTDTPESEDSNGGSAEGDTLAQPTKAPAEEPEALPFQPDPYIHPSGAFGFGLPVGWEISSEDDTSVTVGAEDIIANFSSMFIDVGYKLSEDELQNISDELINVFTAGSDDYEILAQEQDGDGKYVQVSFKLMGIDVIADFIFSQQDTVLYVLNFIAVDYDAMLPTWEAIYDSYEAEPSAVKSSAPEPAPAPPTATPAESSSTGGFDVPEGKALFVFYNFTNVDWNIDVGPHLLQVPANQPGQEYALGQVAIDPGTYTWTAHSPGGGYYIKDAEGNKTFEFTVAAGDVYPQSVR